MDNKTIALIGAVLVLGVAIYGMATGNLPGTGSIDNESENGGDDVGNNLPEAPDPGENTAENETEMATNETGNVTDPVPELEPLPVVCEDSGEDFSSRDLEVASSDPLNTRLAESIIHDRLNELRAARGDALIDPLRCDPVLREVARDHGQLILIQDGARGGNYITSDYEGTQEMIRELGGELEIQESIGDITADDVEVNETRMFDGVCGEDEDDYVLEHGKFAYDVNIEGGSSGDYSFSGGSAADFAEDQDRTRIDDESELAREVRRNFLDNIDALTDESKARQGIGVTIDRRTNEVVVTQVLCGPRPEPTRE